MTDTNPGKSRKGRHMQIAAIVLAVLFGLAVTFGLIAIAVITRGWVLSILWGWFMVPYFELPKISIPLAIGLALVAHLLHNRNPGPEVPEEKVAKYTRSVMAFLAPFVTLFVAWIVKCCL